jgi:hypothetical protein
MHEMQISYRKEHGYIVYIIKYLSQDSLLAFEIRAGDRSYEKEIWIALDLVTGLNYRELNERKKNDRP